ncbi:uncharacterized protein LOC120991865 [Bufo bufo]|uniref:uncharacterized protein LOC120991865 n=1 Tax=Bufo bufo TaxID=8384 RepID=UPI001ABDF69C|nr:uncharacterized protein LOC120991865 [Bufo bufo]
MSLLLALGVLVLGFHHLHSLPSSWPPLYPTARLRGEHVLKCPLEANNISWTFPRKICVKDATNQKTLHLHRLDHRCTGFYTCTNAQNNSHKYSGYLLIDEGPLMFSCIVDSYTSSVLRCTLAEEIIGPSLVRMKSKSSKMDQDWKIIKVPQGRHERLLFDIPLPGFCPFEEQVDPIHVFMEFMSKSEYMSGHRTFYLRDVVLPRAPENVSVTREQIIWSNPSWTHQLSFFPLVFELWVNYRNNTNVTRTTEEQNHNVKDVCTFSVRCRDLYNPSSWSSWTPPLDITVCRKTTIS